MQGQELPYILQNDAIITIVLFMCFFLMSWAIKNGKTYLINHLKNFFIHKERGSLFDKSISSGNQFMSFFGIVTCILSGIYIYYYEVSHNASLPTHIHHALLLFAYIISVIALISLKGLMYNFVNWIFFDRQRNITWMEAYFDLIFLMSFALFPVILLIVFSGLSDYISEIIMLSLLVISKIMLFYKCIRNFCEHYYGVFHIILYFCALEILPDLLMVKWVDLLNYYLTINF